MGSILLQSDFHHRFGHLYSESSRRQLLHAAPCCSRCRNAQVFNVAFPNCLCFGVQQTHAINADSVKRKVSTRKVRFWAATSSALRAPLCLSHLPLLNAYHWVTKSFPQPLTHAHPHQDSMCAPSADISPPCPPDNRTCSYQELLMEM